MKDPTGALAEHFTFEGRPTIPQWTVRVPGVGRRLKTFERDWPAYACAFDEAGCYEPTIVTLPDGRRYLVLRVEEQVEVSTRSVYGATTRRVIEP